MSIHRFTSCLHVEKGYLYCSSLCRDQLREQHALSEEIASAITNTSIGEPIDEDDLEGELEGLEQEAIDERMLNTGTVPVADQLDKLPAAANGEREFSPYTCGLSPLHAAGFLLIYVRIANSTYSQRERKG